MAGKHELEYKGSGISWTESVECKSGQQEIIRTELQVKITAAEVKVQAEREAVEEERLAYLRALEESKQAEIKEAKALVDMESRQGNIIDFRDGQVYKTIKIGGQVWMAENLNYEAADTYCYDDRKSNCEKYGRLYTWEVSNKVCPEGWHLPSDGEWNTLSNEFALSEFKDGWSLGFNPSFGGRYDWDSNRFFSLQEWGYFWSSSQEDYDTAWIWKFMNSNGVRFTMHWKYPQVLALSVRCLQD